MRKSKATPQGGSEATREAKAERFLGRAKGAGSFAKDPNEESQIGTGGLPAESPCALTPRGHKGSEHPRAYLWRANCCKGHAV